MAKPPQGFIVVLPGGIIEIPQDDDKSWLTYQQFGNLVGNLTDITWRKKTGSPLSMLLGRCVPRKITMTSSAPSRMTSFENGITADRQNQFLWKK